MPTPPLQPSLSNDLVRLRPLQEDDFKALYAVASDPLIWEQHPVKTRSQPDGFRDFFQESLKSKGALVVIDQQSDQIIGSSRFKPVPGNPAGIEIGWSFLARKYWGGDYNRAVKGLMIAYALQHWSAVAFFIALDNMRSQKAMEKIGGVKLLDPAASKLAPRDPGDVVYVVRAWQD
ncbi:MAG: GNAT family N-acetyltransferase [Bacteroidota bacterium]